jgi:Xaa-Pro aminopeptidase
MRERFTLVLKGHIAIARAIFPQGTRGSQLDVLARRALWEHGLDYAHGTGHGVGSFLSVHEGPQRIATFGGGDEPLRAGMFRFERAGILQDRGIWHPHREPCARGRARGGRRGEAHAGLSHAFLRADRPRAGGCGDARYRKERDWLNAYHEDVLRRVAPLVEGDVRAWLEAACAPL